MTRNQQTQLAVHKRKIIFVGRNSEFAQALQQLKRYGDMTISEFTEKFSDRSLL